MGNINGYFKQQDIKDFNSNPFNIIGKDWMLVTAGNFDKINTMTASWGGLGVLWAKNVTFTFIRPQRFTKEFVDTEETYSLCFFDQSYKKALAYLGEVSGRDENKIEKAGLTPMFLDNTPCFEEANMVIICKILYHQVQEASSFIDGEFDKKMYPSKDYHTMYVSEIEKIYIKER
ncbi:MAG: flavin reductase family protein [Vallitaleaceae bacterium]|jgi:flavin reductase (DIM6/NTAB) family NADH-FMN oxidoreductase RutF|nr:flavin reductase family protein [Vallitaleaceae bacterium]